MVAPVGEGRSALGTIGVGGATSVSLLRWVSSSTIQPDGLISGEHYSPAAKLLKLPQREKVPRSGRDSLKGQNSHTGEVFQRGPT